MSDNTINTDVQQVSDVDNKPKYIEIAPGIRFTANGRNYFVSDTFSIGRLEIVNLLEEELMMFSNRSDCHSIMKKAMELLNDYKPGEAYMLLYNKIDSDQKNSRLMHYTLRMCAAYINYEGEDLSTLNEETIKQKVNDWSEEGLDVRPFLHFAMSAFKELLLNYKKDILNTLTEVKSIKQALSTELATSTLTENQDRGE